MLGLLRPASLRKFATSRAFGLAVTIDDAVLRPTSAAGTVGWALDKQVAQNHLKRAVRVSEQNFCRWTYGELKRHVDAIAAGFQGLKLAKGDMLALALPNNAESVVSMLAAAKLGVIIVPLPSQPTAAQIEETLASGVKALIFSDSEGGTNYTALVQSIVPDTKEFGEIKEGVPFRSKKFPNLRHLINTGRYRAAGMLRYQWIGTYSVDNSTVLRPAGFSISPSDVFIQSEGKSITHGEIIKIAQDSLSTFNSALPLPSTATFFTAIPFSSSPYAFAAGVVAPQLAGAHAVFSVSNSGEQIEHVLSLDQPEVLVADQQALSLAQEFVVKGSQSLKHAVVIGAGVKADAVKTSLKLSSVKILS